MTINSSELKEYILHNSSFANENTIDMVLYELTNELVNNGFNLDSLDVISGETSINFIGDNIVIRLTYVRYDSWGYKSISDYISHSSAILKPLFEKKINTFGCLLTQSSSNETASNETETTTTSGKDKDKRRSKTSQKPGQRG